MTGHLGCRLAGGAEPSAVETTHHDPTITNATATVIVVTNRRPWLRPGSHSLDRLFRHYE